MSSGRVAQAKAIGTDVEDLVADDVGDLDLALDEDAHHDAVVSDLLCPSLVEASVPVVFAGIPLVEVGTKVEIKACVRRDGHDRRGRWVIKGRDDGQHAALLDAAAMYALAVYDDAGAAKELLAVVIIPASLLDEHLRGSWYGIDRREETLAKLGWPHVLDSSVVEVDC
ncbi:hypothetical protein [Haloarcula sediminis]|uniref:hypothetical protein n=1 Tax=Haloarcula sediminis TaxID=3111777 RepID=UPI002D79BBEA|nr:hypothetical protein [Haloarcula sp. CK38]